MSSKSRSTGSSERSSTDCRIQVERFFLLGLALRQLSFTLRSRSQSGTGKTSQALGPTSPNLPSLSLQSLPMTGMFSHPGPTGHQYRLEQESWLFQTKMDSFRGTLESL